MYTQSFHTHTWRCNHAENTEREYVENALKHGMTTLGFSDHAPYVFEGDYYSTFRMKYEQIAGYFETLEALREEYAGKLDMYIGFEAEYYPKFFSKFEKLIRAYPTEYLILGQHFVLNEMEGLASYNGTNSKDTLLKYVSQVCEAMSTGMFAYVAHPDVIRYEGDSELYKDEMAKLCECAKKLDVPLEINLLGIRTNRHYPNPDFWEVAGRVGNTVLCGSDAHRACDTWDGASFETAMDMVKKYKLNWVPAGEILNGGHMLK